MFVVSKSACIRKLENEQVNLNIAKPKMSVAIFVSKNLIEANLIMLGNYFPV